MKKFFNFYAVAFAAIMAIGSIAFVSCSKDNDIVNPQSETVASTDNTASKRIFPINEDFTDSMGRVWHVKGHGHKHDNHTMELDVYILYYDGVTLSDFTGVVRFVGGTYVVESYTVRVSEELKQFLGEYAWHLLRP